MNTDAKFHSLFNVEQSHMFGLWLVICKMHYIIHAASFYVPFVETNVHSSCSTVRLMITCLDTFLLLQTQYNLQEVLLSMQAQCVCSDK